MSFDFGPFTAALARQSPWVLVFRYDPTATREYKYRFLPNIRCLGISIQEDAHPGVARFRYVFRSQDPDPFNPRRAHEVFGFDKTGPRVIQPDDRLVVRAYPFDAESPDDFALMFDGFVMMPQLDLGGGGDGGGESVTFEAMGTPVRLFDPSVDGSVWLDSDDGHLIPTGGPGEAPADPIDPAHAVVTALPCRFNPDGVGNCTFTEGEMNYGLRNAYPLFCEPRLAPAPWFLGPAARYLLGRWNPTEEYVRNPDAFLLDDLLKSAEPTVDGGPIDFDDPTTFLLERIEVPDFDATGKKMPGALAELINPHGFSYKFVLEPDENNDPYWYIEIYRKDVQEPVRDVLLQGVGAALDPASSNAAAVRLQRDGDLANRAVVVTAQTRYEGSWVLAPLGWAPVRVDLTTPELFDLTSVDPAADRTKYRLWGLDESGEGHAPLTPVEGVRAWDVFVSKNAPPDLTPLFGPADGIGRTSVHRRRKPDGDMLTADRDTKEPRKARLYISKDYAGPMPGEWDGTGTWQEVRAGWELLPDRCGVRLTAKALDDWHVGQPVPLGGPAAGLTWPYPGGVVRALTSTAWPGKDAETPFFCLRLATVIDGDRGVGVDPKVMAGRRPSSPIKFEVTQADEVRDRFVNWVRRKSSPYANPAVGGDDLIRDDTDKAAAHTKQRRRSMELAVLAGPVVIPRISTAYLIGDRIRMVKGRGIDLTMNVIADTREARVYPVVSGIDWTFEGRQQTELRLTDRRAGPPKERTT